MLSDRATLEMMIQATGGVEVEVGGESTWGHKGVRFVPAGSDPEILTRWSSVKVPTEVLPTKPMGEPITVAGEQFTIRDLDSDEEDGAMTVVLLRVL